MNMPGTDPHGRRTAAVSHDEVQIEARLIRPGDVVLGRKDAYGRPHRRGVVTGVNHHRPNDGSGRSIVICAYQTGNLDEAFMPGERVVVRAPRHWTGRKVVFTIA